jgi:hypothetical protein
MDRGEGGDSAQAGEIDVEQDDVGRALGDQAEGAGGVGGGLDCVAERGEGFLENRAELGVVVHDQDATARGRPRCRRDGPRRERGGRRTRDRRQDVGDLDGPSERGDGALRTCLGALRVGRGADDHHSDAGVEGSDAAENLQAADAREVEGDDHRAGPRSLDVEQGFETVLGFEHLVAVLAQGRDEMTPRRGLGLRDHDRTGGRAGWTAHGAIWEKQTRSSAVGACVPTRSVPCRTSLPFR